MFLNMPYLRRYKSTTKFANVQIAFSFLDKKSKICQLCLPNSLFFCTFADDFRDIVRLYINY